MPTRPGALVTPSPDPRPHPPPPPARVPPGLPARALACRPRARGLAVRLRAAAACLAAAALAACAAATGVPGGPGGDSRAALRNALPVADAALSAGQTATARRLYGALAEHFADAPEPRIGLAYAALRDGDPEAAENRFLQAAERAGAAENASRLRAEALLGAGRAALARGAPRRARAHFTQTADAGGEAAAAWIANGLAVAATLEQDWPAAAAAFDRALRLSSGHPRIAANRVRMLAAAGRPGEAARAFAQHDESFWMDGDAAALTEALAAARRLRAASPRPPPGFRPGLALRLAPAAPCPASGAAGAPPACGLQARLAADALLLQLADWPPQEQPLLHLASAAETAGAALPETPGDPPPRGTPGAEAAAPPATGDLILPIGQGRRLPLARAAAAVAVAAPEIADVQLLSPDALYVIGKSVGRTTVAVLSDDGAAEERTVSVVLDIAPLAEALAADPDLADVRVERASRGIALVGEAPSPEAADRAARLAAAALPDGAPVENRLRVAAPQQVNLEVQIAEVSRSVTEDLGVNWTAFGEVANTLTQFRVGRIFSSNGSALVAQFDGTIAPSLAFDRTLDIGGKPVRVAGMIDALATAGLANVLARPSLTAVTGETASFFSGGEYPLPTGFEDGVIIFQYKKYGVLLDFVPTVLDTGRIVLTVRPEVSEPSRNQAVRMVGVDVPVINVRRAETTVEVADGESIVIAGLFRNASNTVETGVPALKDIPGVGALFGHTSTRANELELIVVVTARLTGPSAPRGEAAPGAPSPRIDGYHY